MATLREACQAVYSGDARAVVVATVDGTSGVESVSAVFIKPLDDAVKNGDPIRAILHSSVTDDDDQPSVVFIDDGAAISGVALLIKAVLSLEQQTIPSQTKLLISSSNCERIFLKCWHSSATNISSAF
jgi:acyl transferase domain-containing protein